MTSVVVFAGEVAINGGSAPYCQLSVVQVPNWAPICWSIESKNRMLVCPVLPPLRLQL